MADVRVVGIADINPEAPGLILARQMGLAVFEDFHSLLAQPGLEVVFEVTGREQVLSLVKQDCPPDVTLVDARAAWLMSTLVEARERMLVELEGRARELANTAQSLSQAVEQLVAATEEMAAGAESLARQSEQLNETANQARNHLKETDKILNFIRMVAEQTKLLGLNAAIEAARAGEHGRGFTVVAQEVRKLAENSTASADQIGSILQNIEGSVVGILRAAEEMSQVIQRQAAVTRQVAANTQQLGGTAEGLSRLAEHLASLS
jgi:methyl-accepting chemotaxis protein